jgi:hypothetical protein
VEEGVRLGREGAAVAESIGFTWWRGVTLGEVGERLLAAGEIDRAEEHLRDALEVLADVDDRVNLPIMLAALAALAARQGEAERAGRLWGALEAAADQEPRPTTANAQVEYAPYLEPVRGAAFDSAAVSGRALTIEDAAAWVLSTPG